MKIDISTTNSESPYIQLFLNGKLADEISVGKVETIDDLEGRVRRANIASALVTVVKGYRPQWEAAAKKDREAFLRGLADGLTGEHLIPHPQSATVTMPAEPAVEYEAGSKLATFLKRCAEIAWPFPEVPGLDAASAGAALDAKIRAVIIEETTRAGGTIHDYLSGGMSKG